MARKGIALIFSLVLFFALYAGGSLTETPDTPDGEEVFKTLRCGGCHKEDAKSVGPSLKEMAGLYGEDPGRLTLFLQGEAESIKAGTTTAMMKVQVKKTKALAEADQAALAQYIMGFK